MSLQYLDQDSTKREALLSRINGGDLTVSNQEMTEAFAIDPFYDVNEIPLQDLDPSHPALFSNATHWDHFARLRKEDPVHFSDTGPSGPYWSVTRYEDIMNVDKNHQIFSSQSRLGGITLGGATREDDDQFALPMFIQMDQPKHDEQRKVVAPLFVPKQLADLEPVIRERAGQILDGLPIDEEINWVKHVSVELTGQMLATLFDIPQEDRLKLINWSDTVQNISNPDEFDNAEEAFQELFNCLAYFTEYYEARKKEPRKFDLISMMAHDPATNNMSPQELLGNVILLIVGGNDTTRNSISGGVLALNQNPDQYEKLLQNPGVIPSMVSEIIRWQTPLAHMARTALQDTEIAGKKIKEGDRVCMWYISGNRDESYIDKPDDFIIDRKNSRMHTSFGYGIHRCVGNRLAEMQLRVIWEEIMKRFSKVEVTGEPVLVNSNFIHGIRELPVTLRD